MRINPNYHGVELKIIDYRMGNLWPLPEYETEGSAGMDLRACINGQIKLEPGACILIPTGIAIHIKDPSIVGILVPRSGLGHKHGIILGNSAGVIDSDYQGEIFVSCWNRTHITRTRYERIERNDYTIEAGERIAQLLFMPVVKVNLEVVNEFEKTDRGEGGFGHTGDK